MEWTAVIGVAGTILGMVFGYVGFSRTKANDSRSDGQQIGVILTELGTIKANTDDIKAEQKEQRKLNMEVMTRLTKVEGSVEKAHYRIDHIEGHGGEP